MLSDHDTQTLLRAIRGNKCVLMLGAGFAADAKNVLGKAVPAGGTLAAELWQVLGYDDEHGPYDGTRLQLLYDSALRRLGEARLLGFLRDRLHVREYPDWYSIIADPLWYRVYTTNVDDLLERVFADHSQVRLHPISAIGRAYEERDVFLDSIQYIKLNGSLSDNSTDRMTFGEREFGSRAGQYDVWYDHFVRDYSQYGTILVGTQLNEPLFWQALQAREKRSGAAVERRLRSFLISPHISPALADSLQDYNVVPVRRRADEFFPWLKGQLDPLPQREEVLLSSDPRFSVYLHASREQPERARSLKRFFAAFSVVSPTDPQENYRSLFLLGAAPKWEDLACNLDARREINQAVFDGTSAALEARGQNLLAVISGHRGAGKSTLLMRTAWDMAAAGFSVFFTYGENVPAPHDVASAVDALGRRVLLVVDDAEWIVSQTESYVREFNKLEKPPLMLVALRSNTLYRLDERDLEYSQFEIGDLTRHDIIAVTDVLRRDGKLGKMIDADDKAIFEEFERRARKQLLVALKEVTSGDEFDVIVRKEFEDLDQYELRVTYLVACLATAAGASLLRGQLLAASELPHAAFLSAIDREFKQLLVPVDGTEPRLAARHQLIAELIVDKLAPRTQLGEAYRRLMEVLAHDIGYDPGRGEGRRWFRLYKRLINHTQLFRRFERDIEEARAIFDGIRATFGHDPHYWLQYGSLELQHGELELADHYLHTARTLDENDKMIRHATGHLRMRQGCEADALGQAAAFRKEGEEELLKMIEEVDNPYPWHTLIALTHRWLQRWETDRSRRIKEYERLRELITEAVEAYPWNPDLKDLRQDIDKAYMANAALET